MAFPKTQSGIGPDARGAVGARARAVRGARAAVRGRARPELASGARAPDPAAGRRRRGGARRPDRPRGRRRRAPRLVRPARRVDHPVRPVRAAPRRGRGRSTAAWWERCCRRSRPSWSTPAIAGAGVGRALVDEGIAIERERERPNLLAGAAAGRRGGARVPRGDRVHLPLDAVGPRPRTRRRGGRARLAGRHPDAAHRPAARPPGVRGPVQRRIRRPRDAAPAGRGPDGRPTRARRRSGTRTCCSSRARRASSRGSARPSPGGCRTAASRRAARSGRWACCRAARAAATAASSCAGASHHLREVGVETVTLSVNGRNPRALGLYESEGFRRTTTRDRWAKPVLAASAKGTP